MLEITLVVTFFLAAIAVPASALAIDGIAAARRGNLLDGSSDRFTHFNALNMIGRFLGRPPSDLSSSQLKWFWVGRTGVTLALALPVAISVLRFASVVIDAGVR